MLKHRNWTSSFDESRVSDVVLASKSQLLRNQKGLPFLTGLSDLERRNQVNSLTATTIGSVFHEQSRIIQLERCSKAQLQALNSLGYIDYQDFYNPENLYLFLKDNGKVSLMIGGNDHFSFKSILGGLSLRETLEFVMEAQNELANEYSFSERFGYLSTDPSKTGLGITLSCILYLPSLERNNKIDVQRAILLERDLNLSELTLVDGSSIESKLDGVYLLSSRSQMGITEEQLYSGFSQGLNNLIDMERENREIWLKEDPSLLENLRKKREGLYYKIQIGQQEAVDTLSNLILLEVLEGGDRGKLKDLESLFFQMSDGYVDLALDGNDGIDYKRAGLIHQKLGGYYG